jgi:DNA invertase Pin-like site-specific DNA recombinase
LRSRSSRRRRRYLNPERGSDGKHARDVSQFERRLISQRTKEALAVKKASGVWLGRPPSLPNTVVRRIQRQRARGDSLRKIADDLTASGVPTAQGGALWYAATVRHVLLRTSRSHR